ncbi:MAG: acyltransferase [Polyangiaceae bacterium]
MGSSALHSAIHRAWTGLTYGLSPLALHAVTHVGARARVAGSVYVANRGVIVIGDDFVMVSRPVQSHLVTSKSGAISIGDRVRMGSGCGIASEIGILIGDDVCFGQRTLLLDTDFHGADQFAGPAKRAPIIIEDGAWLGSSVTVLKGVHIGRGARVGSGSVVSCDVAAGAFVFGVPARAATQRRTPTEP